MAYRLPQGSPLFRQGGGEVLELLIDRVTTRWILERGSWQQEDLDFVVARAPKQPLVLLDIGAHIGLMTRQLMHVFPDIVAAVCYEPHPLNFATLSRNLAHLENCSLVQAAVGTVAGQLTFYEDIYNTGNYSLSLGAMDGREYRTNKVECVRAHDEEFLQRLSAETAQLPIIWKSDTQGLDEIIVTSLSDDFWSRVPVALMEISRMNRPALDAARLSGFLERFPIRRFGSSPKLLSVEEILRFADGTDGSHQDLLLAKS
ncbi:MAG: FkbM family methyltransferase [Acetobacteraceae bacterium]